MIRKIFLSLALVGLLSGASSAQSSMTVLVCYPGGSVRAQDAKPAMDSMLRVLEETGNWTKGSISHHFASDIKDCTKFLKENKPQFAILTLGLFLENRENLNLIPLVQPRIQGSSTDKYRILIRQGTYQSIEEMKGKTLGGSLLEEPRFLTKVVFQGKLDPSSYFKLKTSRQVLRSLRDLSKGKLDAVIVNAQQYHALGSLPFAEKLSAIFTSEDIPLMGVLANEKKTTPDERSRFTQALSKMCGHQEGKQLCDLFGLEAFVPADRSAFDKIISLWATK